MTDENPHTQQQFEEMQQEIRVLKEQLEEFQMLEKIETEKDTHLQAMKEQLDEALKTLAAAMDKIQRLEADLHHAKQFPNPYRDVYTSPNTAPNTSPWQRPHTIFDQEIRWNGPVQYTNKTLPMTTNHEQPHDLSESTQNLVKKHQEAIDSYADYISRVSKLKATLSATKKNHKHTP